MRGFHYAAAAACLLLARAHAAVFASPVAADIAVDELPAASPRGHVAPAVGDISPGDDINRRPRVEADDLLLDDDFVDSVAKWIDTLPDPAFAFESASTFTDDDESSLRAESPAVSSSPSPSPIFLFSEAFGDDSNSRWEPPVPKAQPPAILHDGSQKPVGRLDRLWRSALTKVEAVSGVICRRLVTDRSPVQIPITAPSVHDVDDSNVGLHDELNENGYYHQPPPLAEEKASSIVLPSRAITTREVGPTPISDSKATLAAAIPAITSLAAALPTQEHGQDIKPSPLTHGSQKTLIALTLSIALTVTLTTCIVVFISRRNPRRRAERLAAWEESRNRRIFAGAACKYRLRSWGRSTFGRLWFLEPGPTTTKIVGVDVEKDVVVEEYVASDVESNGPSGDRLGLEVHSFRNAYEQVQGLMRVDDGFFGMNRSKIKTKRKQHPADRNIGRTYMWLFGGRGRRSRARSRSGESDVESYHSDSEKSALTSHTTPPPAYGETEKHRLVDDRFLIKIVTADVTADVDGNDDRSSVSSMIPTSPREGSFTLGSSAHDSDSEKGDL